ALRQGVPFEMSSGSHLREYHHVDDDSAAIRVLAAGESRGVIELSHGDAIALRDLATHIFEKFGALNSLKIGAAPNPKKDNFGTVFKRHPELAGVRFRDTLPG